MSKQVPVVARKLLAQSGKPIRISITRLMEELGCGSMSASARQNLPLTNAELSRCSEDITTFRLRKIAWAEQELLRRAEPETSCQELFNQKISNSITCCTMLVVYVIWLYN